MNRFLNQKYGKTISGVAVVLLLACYLFATGVAAQEAQSPSAGETRIVYPIEHVSYGDVWAFTQETYSTSGYNYYGTEGEALKVLWYKNGAAGNKDTTGADASVKYFAEVKFTNSNNLDVEASKVMAKPAYDQFRNSVAQGEMPSAIGANDPIKVINVSEGAASGVYSVVPGKAGRFYVHAYVENASAESITMKYAMLNSAIATNKFAAATTDDGKFPDEIELDRIGETNWYRGEVTVDTVRWFAIEVVCDKQQVTDNPNQVNAKEGNFTAGQDTALSLSSSTDYYYNAWTGNKAYYNTVLAFQIPSGIALGPISSDAKLAISGLLAGGTVTAITPFGESLAVNGSTIENIPNMPIRLNVALEDGFEFKEFQGKTGKIEEYKPGESGNKANMYKMQEDGSYVFYMECDRDASNNNAPSEQVVQCVWQAGEVLLPTITVQNNGVSSEFNFTDNKTGSGTFIKGGRTGTTFTLNAEGADSFVSATYVVSGEIYENNAKQYEGTVPSDTLSFTVTPAFDETKVVIRALDTGGVQHLFTYTLTPVDSSDAVIQNTSTQKTYAFIEDALMDAAPGATLVPLKSEIGFVSPDDYGGIRSSRWAENSAGYTIKKDVTLLVPYISTDLTIDTETDTVEGGMNSTLEHANKKLTITNKDDMLMPQNKVNYTLTIPVNVTVSVASGGRFVIGGTICCGHSSYVGIIGGTAGDHANVQLEGTLNVSGILSSCGYVLGNGQMNVASGGVVYQPFTIMDQRNGQYVVGTTTGDDNLFPWNRFAFLNIQCDVHMVPGASMKGYIDAYTAAVAGLKERHTVACQTIIGSAGALFNLTSGSLDIFYDPNRFVNDCGNGLHSRVGTTTMEFNGDVTIGSLTMSLTVGLKDYHVTSATDFFSIPYNLQIHQKSGTFTVAEKIKLLPGALLYIYKDAALNVTNQLAVMDGFSDLCDVSRETTADGQYANYRYPTAAELMADKFSGSAQLIVDGTMTVQSGGAFGGVVQTTGTGTVEMLGTPGVTVIMGPRSQQYVAMTQANISGRTVYELTPRLYITGENKTLKIETGKTYCGFDGEKHEILNFSYTLYTTASGDGAPQSINGKALNAAVVGTFKCKSCTYTSSETKPTYTTPGDTTYTCSVCGHSYKEEFDSAQVGETKYRILSEAVEAAGQNGTVTILSDIEGEVPVAKEIVIDTQGKAITVTVAPESGLEAVVQDNVITVRKMIELSYFWLDANSEIQLKLQFALPNWFLADENAYVRVWEEDCGIEVGEDRDWTIDVATIKSSNSLTQWDRTTENGETITEYGSVNQLVENEKTYYVFSQGIAAGEMTADVTVEFYNGEGKQNIYILSTKKTEEAVVRDVRQYYELALAKDSESDLTAMCEAMMVFGGHAQLFYNAKTNDLSSSGLDTTKYTSIAPEELDMISHSGDPIGIVASSQQVNLDSDVKLRVFFTLGEGKDWNNYSFSLNYPTGNGMARDDTDLTRMTLIRENETLYMVEFSVPPAYWNDEYVITVTSTAEVDKVYTVSTSVMSWVKTCIAANKNANEVAMANAMYYYNKAADVLFKSES